MRGCVLIFAGLGLLLAANPARAQFPALGIDLNRPDLARDFFRRAANTASASPVVIVKKAGADSPFYLDLKLQVGGPGGSWSVCGSPRACSYNQTQILRPNPHAYGYIARYVGGGFEHYLAASLYAPDQIKRKKSGSKSSIKIKQKAYPLIQFGRLDFYSSGSWSVSSFAISGCKGQADVKTVPGKRTAKLKVTCSPAALAAAAINQTLLQSRLDFLGMKRLQIDLRGEEVP